MARSKSVVAINGVFGATASFYHILASIDRIGIHQNGQHRFRCLEALSYGLILITITITVMVAMVIVIVIDMINIMVMVAMDSMQSVL